MIDKKNRFWLLVDDKELDSKTSTIQLSSDDLMMLTYDYNDMNIKGELDTKEHCIWDNQEQMFLPKMKDVSFIEKIRRNDSDVGYLPYLPDRSFNLETNGHFMLTIVRSRSGYEYGQSLISAIKQIQEDQKKIESGEAITMSQFIDKARAHEGGLMGMMGDAFERTTE